jgi:hypothetical protein
MDCENLSLTEKMRKQKRNVKHKAYNKLRRCYSSIKVCKCYKTEELDLH